MNVYQKLKNLNQYTTIIYCLGGNQLILHLQYSLIDLLKQETKKVYPFEACAMLFGKLSKNEAVVEKIEITQNMLHSTTRFQIDPEDVAAIITKAEKEGQEFIGLFHSHAARATPSLIDLKYMRLWGDSLWLIISSTDGTLAAYQLIDGNVEEVTIRIK